MRHPRVAVAIVEPRRGGGATTRDVDRDGTGCSDVAVTSRVATPQRIEPSADDTTTSPQRGTTQWLSADIGSTKGTTMTATVVPRRRPWVPALNMVLASAALVTAVIALATTPDTVTEQNRPTPTVAAVVHDPATDRSAVYSRVIDGCDRARGIHPC